MAAKIKPAQIKFKTYTIICDALERGIDKGYIRSYKHTDNPDSDSIKEHILTAVLHELGEIIDFGD